MTRCLQNLALCLLGLVLGSCSALTKAEQASPACSGLAISSVVESDAQFIAQAAVELPEGQLTAVLDGFVAARGPQQFLCAIEIAEALLGHPVSVPDAGPPAPPSGSALEKALALNKDAAPGALAKLRAYKASRLLNVGGVQ